MANELDPEAEAARKERLRQSQTKMTEDGAWLTDKNLENPGSVALGVEPATIETVPPENTGETARRVAAERAAREKGYLAARARLADDEQYLDGQGGEPQGLRIFGRGPGGETRHR